MRCRSASAAATRRRAVRGRAPRETRARKRTLSSLTGPPPGSPAPFVAGAPSAAGPPREPLPFALTVGWSARTFERTDLACSTRLASLRSMEPPPSPGQSPSRFSETTARLGRHGIYSDVMSGRVKRRCRAASRDPTGPTTAPDEAQAARGARSEALPLPQRIPSAARSRCVDLGDGCAALLLPGESRLAGTERAR